MRETKYFTSSQLKRFLAEASIALPSSRMIAAHFCGDQWIVGVYTRSSFQCITIIYNPREWQRFVAVCQSVTHRREKRTSLFQDLPAEQLLASLTGEGAQETAPASSGPQTERMIIKKLMVFTAAACITVGTPALLNAPRPLVIGGLFMAGLIAFKGQEISDAISEQIDPSTKSILLKISMALGDLTFGVLGAGCILCTLIFFILIYLHPSEMWHLLELVKK